MSMRIVSSVSRRLRRRRCCCCCFATVDSLSPPLPLSSADEVVTKEFLGFSFFSFRFFLFVRTFPLFLLFGGIFTNHGYFLALRVCRNVHPQRATDKVFTMIDVLFLIHLLFAALRIYLIFLFVSEAYTVQPIFIF